MKKRCAAIAVIALILALAPAARAQYTDNFQTNLISAVTSNWNDYYIVGSNTFADVLLINSGGVLSSASSYIGHDAGSSNNSVLVTDSGSIWSNLPSYGPTYFGYSGAGNSLVISNGGRVLDWDYVGYNSSSSNNSVLVTDSGSLGYIVYFGYSGAGNSLVIRDGGSVGGENVYVGYNSSSSNNSVLVTDNGSVWSNGTSKSFGILNFGSSGAGNSLVISNGGHVDCGYSYVGSSSSGGNNSVLVTGSGSLWRNFRNVYLGDYGAANSLAIRNGGQVGDYAVALGYSGSSSSNNNVLVTGSGSVWSNGAIMRVGVRGPGNSLVISDGGALGDSDGYLGGYGDANGLRSSSNNSVLVSGGGSVWSNRGSFYVGYSGWANSLVISNGGQVVSSSNVYVGYLSSSSYATVRVADGAAWQNNVLHIGESGFSNALVVAGGSVLATNLVIGFATVDCDNVLQLDSGSVYVTNATGDAVLEVRNGSFIQSGGVVQADILVVTNPCARFIRNGGTLTVGTLVLDPNMSAVGDGIPNGWKQQYGLDPFDPSVANADPDGDGMSNLQEYLAGTDPTSSASAFRIIGVVETGSDIVVTWMTGTGKNNALQAAGDGGLYGNSFTDVFIVTNTIGTVTNYLDAGGATNGPTRFYRVRLVP